MKKRTSSMSRRIVSLLMSMVLTLTLVTPAAFATEVVDGSGTTIVEGDTNPADPAPGEDSENNEDKNTEDGKDEQPTEPGDEDKNPDEDNGDDASKPDGDSKDKENPDGDKKDEENKNEQPTEDENNGDDEIALLNAENAADAWDGKDVNTDWYTKAEDGTGTADKPYEINTAAQLAGLAQLVNGGTNFSGKTIKLAADIDLNNQAWTPIGNENGFDAELAFSGTFNGDGYTVSGLNVPDTYFPGLFGQISTSAAVQNLIVKGSVTGGEKAYDIWGEAAGVVCDNNGTVQNCGFYGSVNDEIGLDAGGGVAGGGNGKVLNCWYYMTDESSSVSVVSVCTATNCVVISSSGNMPADKLLATLQTNAPDTGKVWSWKEGDAYPTLVSNVSRSMTLKPYLNSCTAKVSVSGLTGESGVYLLENGVNTVTLLLDSGYSGENVYVRTNAANADGQIQLTTSGVSVPIGNAEKTILYYGTEEDFEAGKWYTAGDAPYQISTGRELVYLAQLVNDGNNFSGKTIVLTANIDLSLICHAANGETGAAEVNWTPIGVGSANAKEQKPFSGTFDGQGHTISGLYINNSSANQGLFGYIDRSAIVQNLIVTGSVTTGGDATGGIVGKSPRNSGTVRNCGFYGTVTATGTSGGVVGGGKAENCWYYSDGTASNLDVCGGTATNCVVISSADPMKAAKLATLQTNAPETGKVWSWKAGDAYPTLIDPPKTITMQPVFPDCTAAVSANGTPLSADKKYTYEVTEDSVVITVSDSSKTLYYAASESEKDYKPEGGSLTKIDSTTFNKNDLPKTYYYGTEEDFQLLAAWNSALGRSGNTATISTAAQLKALARMVNSGKDSMTGKTITLGASIDDLRGIDWTPIGTEKNPFKGTFTGYSRSGGYATISGLSGDLFGVVEDSKTKIQYVTISGGKGRLVTTLKSGTVENCMSTADVTGAGGGLVGQNSGTVNSCYYYNAKSKNTPAVVGSGTVTKCFYLADTSTFGADIDTGARTAEEFQLGRVAYELGGSSYVWVYDTTKAEKMPQLGNASTSLTMAAASELKLTKPDNQPEDVVVTLGSSDKKVLTDVAGNQYYYAASGYIGGVSDVPVTFTAPKGYQIVFAPAATQVGGKDYLRITGSNVEYTYSLVKADIRWYESAGAEKNYVLKSADELMGFCLLANGSIDGVSKNFNGWTLSLGNNIDLENSEWKPIPRFAGAFDGKGYEITGLNVNYTGGDFNSKTAGMFEKLVSPGQILNLAVSGSVQADGKINYVGGIVGTTESGSEIRFCRSNIAVKVDAANSTTNGMAYGGVTGKVQGAISNCLNEGTITVDNIKNKCYIGGVAGQVGSAADLCWNTGSVTASSTANKKIYTGGIVGYGAATNCYNNGSVTGATDKNRYVTGGISGNGNVTNSYNLGDVTGAESGTYGISSRAATNSYYLCKLNGAVEQKYIKDSSSEAQNITATTEGNKTVYKVDGTELVELLNKNRSTYTEWINKQVAPYNPVHITRWDGSFEPGVEGVITLIYDPNGGEGAAVTEQQRVEGDTGSFTIKSDTELGFKHENGTFLGWSTKPKATTADSNYAAGKTVSVKKGETVTLYAVWSPIWAGSGTEADAYQISNAADLTALQTQVNDQGFTYDGKWFKLTDSISLTGNWTPIGTPMAFAGSLDGNGKTIDGLNVNVISGNAGLFDSASGGTFKDLKLNGTVNGTFYTGGLIGGGSGVTLDNIEANVTVSGGSDTGGLVGRLLGTLPATAERTPDISNCTVHGSVIGRRYVGGIATSSADNSPKIENCHNYASITSTGTGGNNASAAGIWACNTYNANGKFINCTNNGAVTAQKYAAGIATAGTAVIGCVNSNAVVSNNGLAGGISNNAFTVERCGNVGSITGCKSPSEETGVAGIDNYGQNVLYCYNTGVVTCDNEMWAYGISANGRSKIRNSFSYVAGKDLGLTPNLPNVEVTNSYYLASSATAVSSAGEYATLADFASGKVAWGVGGKGEGSQGGTGQDAKLGWWKQDKNDAYPTLLDNPDMSKRYYRTDVDCGTGGEVELARNASSTVKELSSKEAVYGPAGTSVTIKATPKDNTFGLKSLTWTHNGQTDVLPAKGTTNIVMPAESNGTIHAEFASVGPGGNGGYYYGGSGDGTGTGDKDDEGLQDGLNMDVEYDIKGLVLGAYAEWGSNGGNKSFQKWLEENPNVVRALLTNSLDNMATAAVGKKTDEAKDLAALLLASLNEHTGVDGKNGDTIAKALQKYIDSGSEEVFSAWLTGGGGMASGTYESIYGQYASSLAALADRLYSKWEASGTSMTFPVWLDSQQVTMESLSENAEEPDAEPDDTQTTEAPEDVPDGQDTEGGASGNSVWEVIGTVVRENPILVWSIVAVIAALIIVGAVRRYHKVKRDERDDNGAE